MNNKRIISYYGGKHTLAPSLIEMMPPHKTYIEPLAGGLSVFFRKKKADINILNDYDGDIANLYYVCSKSELFEQFKRSARMLIQHKSLYDHIRDKITNEKYRIKMGDAERAAEYFFFITTSFNNRPGTSMSKDIKYNDYILERVEYSRKKLNDTIIYNMDVNDVIDKYKDVNNAFWFFDPPYYVANGTSYYGHVFREYHHLKFKESIDILSKNKKSKWMITYDNHPMIRKLFKKYFIRDIVVKYTSSHESIDTSEIIISNYEINDKQKSLF